MPSLRILTPQKWLFWGPGPLLCRFKPFHWRVQGFLGLDIFQLSPWVAASCVFESCDNWGYEDWEDGGSPQETNALKQTFAHVLEALYPPGNKHIPQFRKRKMIFKIAIPRKYVSSKEVWLDVFIVAIIVVTNIYSYNSHHQHRDVCCITSERWSSTKDWSGWSRVWKLRKITTYPPGTPFVSHLFKAIVAGFRGKVA